MASGERESRDRELEDLAALLAAFNETTAQLKASHDRLQERMSQLTGEQARKNEELAATLAEVSALKNYLASILESISDGVLAIDLDGYLVAMNQAAREIIPDLAAERESRAAPLRFPPAAKDLQEILAQALAQKKRFTNIEIGLRCAAGQRILAISASPIRDGVGALLGAVATFRDLTEHKDLEARARRQDRLAALGEMAAGVAHEIRNPLNSLRLTLELLER
ncbi:MAG: PAS domain-containing protein, partial [Planctomycetota bacterium]|nr:PAS domain-containing protein [Planctomycetota bacterium]